jgi:hypothetical protein
MFAANTTGAIALMIFFSRSGGGGAGFSLYLDRLDGDLMNRWRAIYMRPVSRSGVAPAGRIANPLIVAGPRRSRHSINSDFLPFGIQPFLLSTVCLIRTQLDIY